MPPSHSCSSFSRSTNINKNINGNNSSNATARNTQSPRPASKSSQNEGKQSRVHSANSRRAAASLHSRFSIFRLWFRPATEASSARRPVKPGTLGRGGQRKDSARQTNSNARKKQSKQKHKLNSRKRKTDVKTHRGQVGTAGSAEARQQITRKGSAQGSKHSTSGSISGGM